MSDNDGTCSVAKLAELLNLSPRRLQQLAKQGVIPKDVRGEYELVGAVRGYSQYLQEQASREDAGALLQAKIDHEVLKVQERRSRLEQMRGKLVDRDRATALVFRLAREERDSWVTWPTRVAALMAAELGIDPAAMQISLERHVREHLEELAEIKPEFR